MGNHAPVSHMPYPSNREIELPLLKEISDTGGELDIRNKELFFHLACYFPQITDEELVRRTRPSETVWENRVQFAFVWSKRVSLRIGML